jgi:hypothetical protein
MTPGETMPQPKGEQHPSAKLNEEAVRDIRRRYRPGWISYADLGEKYGVTLQLIAKVVHRQAWSHVE